MKGIIGKSSLIIRIFVFLMFSSFIFLFRGKIFELLRFSRPYLLFIFLILILLVLFFMKEILYYLFSKETKVAPARKIEVFLTFILLIVMIFQAITLADQERILDKQKGISETQTEILKSTSQSLRPKIILTPYQINYEYYLNNDFLQKGDNLEIAIINLGETIAPLVNVQIIDSNFFGGKSKDIENLESLGYSRANFTILPDNKEIYPGLYNVTFIVRCPLCEKEFDYQSMTICLFNENFNISNCEF